MATTCRRCGEVRLFQFGAFDYALSRVDNRTEICSYCGRDEAVWHFCNPDEPLTYQDWALPPQPETMETSHPSGAPEGDE